MRPRERHARDEQQHAWTASLARPGPQAQRTEREVKPERKCDGRPGHALGLRGERRPHFTSVTRVSDAE